MNPLVSALSWHQVGAPVFHKAFVYPIVFRFFVGDSPDGSRIEAVDNCSGTGQKEWRMGADDKLGLSPIANIRQDLQEIELAVGG